MRDPVERANRGALPPTLSRRAVVLVALWLLMVFILECKPLHDMDTFWQVRAGQLMLESGRLVTRDQFTYSHAGRPAPAVGWLAQLAFAVLFRVGSWGALQAAHAALFAGAFLIAGWGARDERGGLLGPVAAVLGGFVTGLSSGDVRPQGVALFCFAVLLALARGRWPDGWKVAGAVPVLLVWQNAHPSVLIGGAAVAALAAGEWALRLGGRPGARPWGATLLVPLVGASQFATPSGRALLTVSRVNLEVARDVLRVSEWLPPWDPAVLGAVVPFWALLGVTAWLLLRLRFRVDPRDLSLVAVMTPLALSASRLVLFWGLAMVPAWASWVERARPAGLLDWRGGGRAGPRVYLPVLLGGVATALVLPAALGFPRFSPEIPVRGIDRLRQALPAGRIYNYREWGGPLILANSPAWKVAIDGRLYLFSRGEWQDYNAAALGLVPVGDLVRRHRPDAFFLRPGFHGPLIAALRRSGSWRELYADEDCAVFTRPEVARRARSAGPPPPPTLRASDRP